MRAFRVGDQFKGDQSGLLAEAPGLTRKTIFGRRLTA
jgi:hypothetical protein